MSSSNCIGVPPEGKNVIGQMFGRLIAVEYYGKCGSSEAWLCRCSCGGFKVAKLYELQRGKVKSCGCLRRSRA
jgi:hypothetical protein